MVEDPDEKRRRQIAGRVVYWMARRGMTRAIFAGRMGRSLSWVDKIKSGDRNLDKLPVLERVAEVLDVPLAVLLDPDEARLAAQCVDRVEVAAVRAALGHYNGITAAPDRAVSLSSVDGQLRYARAAFQASDLTIACRALPRLILDAQHLAAETGESEAVSVSRLLVHAYGLAASVLLKFDQGEAAWLAADRAMHTAQATDDLTCLAGASRAVARAMLDVGQGRQATDVLTGMAARLEPHLRDDQPELLSLYGMLLLRAEIAAARIADPVLARDMNHQAAMVAARLAEDRNDHGTAFGPTNVILHRLAALVRLHDAASALDFAGTINPNAVARLPRERRVNYFLDLADANRQRARHSEAVAALVTADGIAPDEVRCRPITRHMIADLLRAVRTPSLELRTLATNAGLTT